MKLDGVCKLVTEIKDHAKNFLNAPRISAHACVQSRQDLYCSRVEGKEEALYMIMYVCFIIC